MLSALMAQTNDSMVCFKFRVPVDPSEAQDAINAKLRDATVLEASRSFARYFGFKNRRDIIGKHLLTLFRGEIPAWFVDYGQEVEDGDFEDIERVVHIPVGDRLRPMRIYMQNIFEHGKLVCQWLTIRDISKETERERLLESNEQMHRLALEAVGLRTFSVDLTRYAGRTPSWREVAAAVDWQDPVHAEDQPIVDDALRAFCDGETERLHTLFRTVPSGSARDDEIWMESWAVADRRAADGKPQSMVGVVMDRTQSKALEARMIASQRLESLGVLAGGIAHDFNNLLLSITGSVDVLLSKHQDLGDDLKVIDEASRHASQLCDQLLTYAGRGSAELKSTNLSDVVRSVSDLLSVSIDDNAQLDYRLDDACWVDGDGGQLFAAVHEPCEKRIRCAGRQARHHFGYHRAR